MKGPDPSLFDSGMQALDQAIKSGSVKVVMFVFVFVSCDLICPFRFVGMHVMQQAISSATQHYWMEQNGL